jgi:hypothetical protein
MDISGRPKEQRAVSDLLALRLIELAIGAGWKPRDCIEFAREAYKFLSSTQPQGATQQLLETHEPPRIDQPPISEDSRPPQWGPDLEARRHALQTLANQNRTMYEAAKILGISKGLVASTARRMNISFHGLRRLHSSAPAETNATAELANGIATTGLVPAAAMDKAVTKQPGEQCMKRRCPACNQIFETTEISDYFCGDCGNASPLAH